MANTFTQQTAFLQDQYYYEEDFAKVWAMGMPSFITKGGDISTDNTISAMEGVNNGVFFKLSGKQDIPTSGTTNLYIHSHLAGVAGSYTELKSDTANSIQSTDTDKYFKIFALSDGEIVEDFRHQDFIKDMEVVGNSASFSLRINGKESNSLPLGDLQNAYTKSDAQFNFVWKQDIIENLLNHYSETRIANVLYLVQEELEADQIGNRAEYRKEKYALIPNQTSSSTIQENALRTLIADLTGDVSTSNIFIEWKPLTAEATTGLQNLIITYEGDGSHVYHYQTNNYKSGTPTKNSDFIAMDTQNFGDIRMGTSSLAGDRDRSFVGYSGLANLNTGNNVMLDLNDYSLSQVEKLTLVFSNYEAGSTNTINQNICQVNLTNFISGGAHDGYDGFYDTHVINMPFSAYNYTPDNYVPSFIKAFNVETTSTGGEILGKSDAIVYTSGGDSFGYCLRTVFVTIANKHYGSPNFATMKNSDMTIKRTNDDALRNQVEEEKIFIENGNAINLDSIETEDEKVARLVKEQLELLGVNYENN